MREKIIKLIIDSLKELNVELENPELENPTAETSIYGASGNLDSLALVNLIVDIEEKISNEFEKNVVLADEKAMSQTNSPFRTIERLADYITKLLREEKIQ